MDEIKGKGHNGLIRHKLPWGMIAQRLDELNLGTVDGGEWTIDELISFHVIQRDIWKES